ncbi:lipopolysaccharide heptosyltransferase [Sulfurovum lithotrophicum]|uniref:Lipopolysaccharide heptosyltransferase 1 n=1 Tax=Sulfurovum lithotrophicum TaxID=206403 RepID=A0A7U4RQ00_9BACT|nr:lipopolysaccharide heptosyltransferase I [Sulfurovum lithotrophicum]AKF24343.1 lipopolysaccharide heptosyltransferase [Sulfurovum lithotrophicum]
MKVAIVKLSAMGDIIHAMAALQFMKAYDPSLRIDWIVEEVFAPILEHNPDIDHILPVNLKGLKKKRRQFLSEVQKVREYATNNYDVVIDAQGLIKSAIVSRMLGSTTGFDRHSIRESMAAFFYGKTFFIPYEMNVIERNMKLMMQAIGSSDESVSLAQKKPFLFFTEENRQKTVPFLEQEDKNIVYILGSSWESKIYPREKFLEVIKQLTGNHLLVWGNESEKKSAEYIAQHSEAKVLPEMTLNELKALIASSDLVIGGDSGPTHMAWALNRPSITLFGPTPAKRNTLETEFNRVLDCGKAIDPKRLDREDLCIADIPVDQVVILAKELCK